MSEKYLSNHEIINKQCPDTNYYQQYACSYSCSAQVKNLVAHLPTKYRILFQNAGIIQLILEPVFQDTSIGLTSQLVSSYIVGLTPIDSEESNIISNSTNAFSMTNGT